MIQIDLIRHATLVVRLDGIVLLVDPMLSPAGAMDPVANAADQRRIPLVDLPIDDQALQQLLAEIDGVLVTHTHRDHWDAQAIALLPKTVPLLCQPADAERLRAAGFTTVLPITIAREWRGLTITRTGGQHGTGAIGQQMGPVSGFVVQQRGAPTIYIAGDTIWCAEVADAVQQHRPAVAILNAGAAQFLTGDPITMTAEDVGQVCRALPGGQVIAVHMEAINHCWLRRADLRAWLDQAGLTAQVRIPADGERIAL
jgi:L-ascorbate metabolism protein UlaG (beta-lactamase superfamily)